MMKRVVALSLVTLSACAGVAPVPAVVPGVSVRFEAGRPVDTVVFRRSVSAGGRDSSAGARTVVRVADRLRLHSVFAGGLARPSPERTMKRARLREAEEQGHLAR